MDRRSALKYSLLAMGGFTLPGSLKAHQLFMETVLPSKKTRFGVQLFTIPQLVDQDLPGTLKTLGELGYKEIEFFGPYPFSSETAKLEFEGFKGMIGVKDHAFFGHSVKDVTTMLKGNGLTMPSLHVNVATLRENLEAFLDGVAELEPKYATIPLVMTGRDSLDDYKRLAEEFNTLGEKMAKYNMKFAYHNHGYEHIEMDGVIPMNYLLENTDSKYVAFELDVFWMSAAGADPKEYLKKYKGRYEMLHVKDSQEVFRFSGDGGSPDQWMAGFPKMADPGDGVLDIPGILKVAKKSGVEHFFLERDVAPQPQETLRNSIENLKTMT